MSKSVKIIRRKGHKVLDVLILCSMLGLSSGDSYIPHTSEKNVSTSLYGSVTLPCTFSFIQSKNDLTVIWEKEENNRKLIVYKFINFHEYLEEQDPRYRGRVNISTNLSQGNLDLILRNVTYEDEGTYYCRAANKKTPGDKKVTLSIKSLDADKPTLTRVTINGKRRWKCRGSGVYHNPQVQWNITAGEDLSSYGTISVTEESNGWKLVESLLDYDVEEDVEVICHIMEGRLKESARGIISDNEKKKESPDPVIIICAVIGIIILIIVIIIITTTIIPLLSKHNHSPHPDDTPITSDVLTKEKVILFPCESVPAHVTARLPRMNWTLQPQTF